MGISISITAGADKARSSVKASGSVQHVITDKERGTFGLSDSALKDAVGKYFGKNPNDAFLHSPTPWDDLYKTYGWPQVQTVLVVRSAQVVEITSNPEIIKTTRLVNTSKKAGTFSADVSDSVTNTTETNWSQTSTIEVSQSINYGVEFEGLGVGGSTTMSYSQSFGVGGSQSSSVTVGSSQGVSVDLGPGESVDVQLTASRGSMKVRIAYNAYLIGATAVNYNPTFKDHHFWALDIGAVMQSGGIANSKVFTEDIQVAYYSNAEVKLSDPSKRALQVMAA